MNKHNVEEKIMKRRGVKVYFDNEDMDFNLTWVLGQARWRGRTRRVYACCLAD